MEKKVTGPDNRDMGQQFEDLFKKQAQMQGFFVEKNYLPGQMTPFGFSMVKKETFCELDWKLVHRNHGRIGFFETKSYDKTFFTFSELDAAQVARSVLWNEMNVPSGFVVWFRPINMIFFYPGRQILKGGPGNRFRADEGIYLGGYADFALGNLFLYPDNDGILQG